MFLAGEEFGDVHDTDYNATDPKQQDPCAVDEGELSGECGFAG